METSTQGRVLQGESIRRSIDAGEVGKSESLEYSIQGLLGAEKIGGGMTPSVGVECLDGRNSEGTTVKKAGSIGENLKGPAGGSQNLEDDGAVSRRIQEGQSKKE